MGFQQSKNKNDFSDLDEFDNPINAEINITPLTDVFLVLLIIFMVTSSVISQMGVQVQLPKSTQAASSSQAPGVIVTITKLGEVLINGMKVSEKEFINNLSIMLSKTSEKNVILEGDREAVLGNVVKIMDDSKKAGALKFSVSTKTSD